MTIQSRGLGGLQQSEAARVRHMLQEHGETQVMLMGRDRERLDVLDFLRCPPGSLTESQRTFVDEIIRAIERGQHVNGARRLYDDAWATTDIAGGEE